MTVNFNEVVVPIVEHALAPILFAGILFLFKVPKAITIFSRQVEQLTAKVSELVGSINKLNVCVEHLEKRAQVSDRILSDLISQPVDTDVISKDGTKYPRIKKKENGGRDSHPR